MDHSQQIAELLNVLESDTLDDRITAIQALGEIGDIEALQRLRERMKVVSREHYALYIAIGKALPIWMRQRLPQAQVPLYLV